MPRITISVKGQATQPYRFPLDRTITHIGRCEDNDVVVPSKSVSRLHCSIRRVPAGFIIEDHRSTNGLTLKGVKYKIVELEHKITIQLSGEVTLNYTVTHDEQTALAKETKVNYQQVARPNNPPRPTKEQLDEMLAATTRVDVSPYDGSFWNQHLSSWVLYLVLGLLSLTFGVTFRHFHLFLFP